jgi:large subunit ribosomal protein L13
MMPKNKIGRHMLGKLKLYAGAQHPHQAQAPMPLDAVFGRPAPAGALYVPEPVAKTPRAATPKPAAAPAPDPAIDAGTATAIAELSAPPDAE